MGWLVCLGLFAVVCWADVRFLCVVWFIYFVCLLCGGFVCLFGWEWLKSLVSAANS